MSRRIFDKATKTRPVAATIKRAARKAKGDTIVGSTRSYFEPNFTVSRITKVKDTDKARNGTYLHVSDLLHNCIRKKALQFRLDARDMDRYIREEDGVMYAIGHSVQSYVTRRLIASSPEEIYGTWKCKCGKSAAEHVTLEQAHKSTCHYCNTPLDQYNEIKIENEEYFITGSIDLILAVDGALYLNEIKSMVGTQWGSLSQPVPEHVLQLYMYYWLATKAKIPVHDRASILYISKEYKWGTFPIKEYQLTPSIELQRIMPLLDLAKSYKIAVQDSKAPLPKRPCPSINSTAAKNCPMCSICFQIE